MREICTSGSVRGEGGNILTYSAMDPLASTDGPARLHTPSDPSPIAWVLHDGKAGMASQALGLAEATGFPFIEKRLAIRFPWTWLPPQLSVSPRAGSTSSREVAVRHWRDDDEAARAIT